MELSMILIYVIAVWFDDYNLIRASQGFDGVFETGEASRCKTLIANLKLNANNKLAYAA